MGAFYRCRLCLKVSTKKVDIFKDDFPKMIEILAGLKIDPHDGLLKSSCLECAKDVKFAMLTRKHIIRSHKILIEELWRNKGIEYAPTVNTESNFNPTSATIPLKSVKRINVPQSLESDINNDDDFVYESILIDCTNSQIKPEDTAVSENKDIIIEEITIYDESKTTVGFNNELDESLKAESADNLNTNIETPIPSVDTTKSVLNSSMNTLRKRKKQNKLKTVNNKSLIQPKTSNARKCNVVFIRKQSALRQRAERIKNPNSGQDKPKRGRVKIKKHVPCTVCKKEVLETSIKEHLKIHFPKPHTCEICGATTRNERSLKSHISYWHKSRPEYICDKCGKKYRSRHILGLHEKKEHGGTKDFECNICGKRFFQNMHLNRHINGIHKKLRPYKCEYCGKNFAKRTHLVIHWRTHTNEAPYSCEMCGERFRIKLSLKNHLKRVHNVEEEEKVFCEICNKGFASDKGLRAHLNSRIHEGQKCQYCSEVFTGEYMTNHLRVVHGVGNTMERSNSLY